MKTIFIIFCSIIQLNCLSQSFYDPSLIFWLPIVNDYSEKDISIYGHDIELKNKEVIFDFDRFDRRGAYTFTGNLESFIQTKHSQEFAYSNISICVWAKSSNMEDIGRLLVLPTENGGQNYSLNFNLSSSKTENAKGKVSIYFDPEDDTGGVSLLSKTNIADNNWHFIVGIIDSKKMEMKIFVDGLLEGEKKFSSRPKPGIIGKLQIGRHSEKYKEYYKGSLDDIMIFSRALSSNEVKFLYNR